MEVRSGAEVIVSVAVRVPSHDEVAPSREDFTTGHARDLRHLIASDVSPEVRRAATAVLEFASGKSYAACAEATPYGVRWVRALVAAFREGGIEALLNREYRQPRNKP